MAVLITGATALLEGIDLSDYFTSDQIVITTEKLPSMPFVQKKGTSVQYAQVKADAPDINKLYDIAEKILLFLKHPENIKRFGENGKRRVEAYYQKSDMIRRYQALYQEATDGRNRL
jgi:hypothetical protein